MPAPDLISLSKRRDWASAINAVRLGADVHATDDSGQTTLHWAAYKDADIDYVQLLIEHGADVNAKTNAGATPLHYVAYYNASPGLFKLLIAKGADAKAKDKDGKTALDVLNSKTNSA